MNDGDGGGFLLVCAAIIGMPALLVLLTALVPGYVKRTRDVMRKWPIRSLLLGLVNFLFFFAIGMLVNVGFAPIQLLGALSLFIVLPILLSIGLLAAAGVAGDRLWQQIAAKPASLIGSLVLGLPLLGLASLVPVLGWLLFLGLVLAGLGAALVALGQSVIERFRRNKVEAEPALGQPA